MRSLDQPSGGRRVRVLDLDPVGRPARPIRPTAAHIAERHRRAMVTGLFHDHRRIVYDLVPNDPTGRNQSIKT
jgi:hypothetical protein